MIAAREAVDRFGRGRRVYALGIAVVGALATLMGPLSAGASATPLTGVDLSTYVRVGRYDLPEPTRTPAPPNSLLAQEASAVTYDWDTNTLFVVGDGGTSVVQVTKTGQLIDSMTLPPGGSPQGTEFYDTEGLAYVGGGKFVFVEERDRQVDLFTYVPGGTLTRAATKTVKLGTTVGNIGLEGVTNDPMTSGFVLVKEVSPEGIFQTGIDFNAGTATNGSPTTVNSINLFDPALAGTADFADVFSLSNVSTLTGPDATHLLLLSQESAKILNISRSGAISSTLTLVSDPGNPLSMPDQQPEGVAMDNDGKLYLTTENGGGDIDHPQVWVFAPSTAANQPPTAVTLNNQVTTLPENTSTATRLKVADVAVTDDGIGTNNLTVTGPDAAFFEVDSTGLYIKAGTVLDFETKSSYSVNVAVDDPTVGATPDATSATYTLTLTDVVDENPTPPSVIVSEVSPWSSGSSPYAADWFEVTNTGTTPVDMTGWKMDDNSNAFGSAVSMVGVGTVAPGKSAVFIEGTASTADAFKTSWFGASVPPGFQIGSYTGAGVGLSTGGDAVNVFDGSGNRLTGISFGTSTTAFTFDNAAGLGSTTLPLPVVSKLSVAGHDGAFVSGASETGSPGTAFALPIVSEVSPWSSGNSPYAADWFEVTNPGTRALDITGWKMDDNSNSFGSAVALTGVTSIGGGKSAIFIEGTAATPALFTTAWFGTNPPSGFAVGFYGGSGVGLSTAGDAVNLFDASGARLTGVSFGASTSFFTFDNAAGVGSTTLPLPAISTLSVAGSNGAFVSGGETGSPGRIAPILSAPLATTGAASAITDTSASVAGTANAGTSATNYTFEYGPTLSFGSISPIVSAGSGGADVPETATLSGLTANTTYYYRLVATNAVGTSSGTVRSFRTTGTPQAPLAVTGAATGVTNVSATLAGQVNPRGQQTAYTIEYGTSPAFGSITPVVALDSGDGLEPVSEHLTGLTPDTTYYYRTVATNATGTAAGLVGVFSTGPGGPPIVSTGVASSITGTSAVLAGTIDAHGIATTYTFEYGTTNTFGSITAVDSAGSTDGVLSYSLPVSGLTAGTSYRFRIVATNANGTTFGTVGSFTTTGGPGRPTGRS